MTETQLKNTIQKAQRADELLNDPLIQEFIIAVRGELLHEFESSKLHDEKAMRNAWHKSQVFNQFLDKFTAQIKEGKNAEFTLLQRVKNKVRHII
tara:strand:- start:14083 stop:14367 length:285 start_codon:yes stop_codon:yes gene_type:complete